jgi:hypothetical protein
MTRFANQLAAELYQRGSSGGLPRPLWKRGHQSLHLLLAAHELSDVEVIGPVSRWHGPGSPIGLHLGGKWYVTFYWESTFGAHEIRLEKRRSP